MLYSTYNKIFNMLEAKLKINYCKIFCKECGSKYFNNVSGIPLSFKRKLVHFKVFSILILLILILSEIL